MVSKNGSSSSSQPLTSLNSGRRESVAVSTPLSTTGSIRAMGTFRLHTDISAPSSTRFIYSLSRFLRSAMFALIFIALIMTNFMAMSSFEKSTEIQDTHILKRIAQTPADCARWVAGFARRRRPGLNCKKCRDRAPSPRSVRSEPPPGRLKRPLRHRTIMALKPAVTEALHPTHRCPPQGTVLRYIDNRGGRTIFLIPNEIIYQEKSSFRKK